MATFNFKTGNANIDGKIDYSYTRTQTGFTVKYAVYMRRNNTYTGTPTNGTINYKFYISSSCLDEDSKYITISNNKAWCIIVSGSKTYALDTFTTGSFRVGFESTPNGDKPIAFKVTKQMSSSTSVPAYATYPSLSNLSVVYNAGDNYFTFKGTIGNNGKNNTVTGCKVFYTTNGQTPTASSPNFIVSGKEKTSWVKKINISALQGNQTIKARISTLALVPLGNVDTPEDGTQSWTVAYYSPPYPLQNLNISYNTSRPTPNSTYTFKWKLREVECDGYNNYIGSYRIKIYVKGALKKTITLGESQTAVEGKQREVELTGKELELQKGNELKFSVVAIGKSQYNNTSSEVFSSPINILSAGVAKIKTSNNWKEGQVWIKTEEKWVRSTGVYVKTSNGWKQSL